MTVLILGGTSEARALAAKLQGAGVDAVTSLAGAVGGTSAPPGRLRVGGFGGASRLVAYLAAESIRAVVDATHPFAARMSANAAQACAAAGVPLLRLSRPSWRARPDAASWYWVADLEAARVAAERLGQRVFLSVGRQSVAPFLCWTDRYVLLRVVEAPDEPLPPAWELLRARGPYALSGDRTLLAGRRIDVLVTKDAGGTATAAKLDAAAELGVAVVVVERPADPAGVPLACTVGEALDWVLNR